MRFPWLLVVAAILSSFVTGAGAEGYCPFALPLDPAAGSLRAQGPSAMRVGPGGDIYVASPLKGAIMRFSPTGALVRTTVLSGSADPGARPTIVDFVCGPGDELSVLQVAPRGVSLLGIDLDCSGGQAPPPDPCPGSIIRVRSDGTTCCLARIPSKRGVPRLLDRIESDGQGNLFVHDGFDNGILRFDRSGRMFDCGVFEGFPELALDRTGGFYGALVDAPTPSAAVTVWRVDLASRERKSLAKLKLASPVTFVSILGADSKGQLYVEVAHGPNEQPTGRAVWVVTPGGAVVSQLPVPERPWEFRMSRPRAVIPAGGVLTARVKDGRVLVEPHL
ncbi:MAG: hypothetical protein HY815_18475 [Candidatus Riflebacteria bacterium]|nr:hypothetical protein [Candidatus Riflebacteria bacterium]